MPTRARVDEFIAVVESGDHAGAIERYYTEDASMQENTSPPRIGRDGLVAFERGILAQMKEVRSKALVSVVEGDYVMIHWNFDMTDLAGKTRHVDEIAMQEWHGDRIFRERFFYNAAKA
ncbi:nuclear transport factor 2 family protein [Afipia massiliensis]|uniref:Nuclear transport factor 2 family protein n=1 Tax=Afipia massiliensis TaxID=211460 RepID=A0A4U6BMB2_9BRAD|nr:nuclear transport factor 2 family protein [Afipia massiliensis]TKT71456.1 nuclear transport factor 2 family protein [Afipia massiliensis]